MGTAQAEWISSTYPPRPLLKLGIPKLTTVRTEVEATIDAIKK